MKIHFCLFVWLLCPKQQKTRPVEKTSRQQNKLTVNCNCAIKTALKLVQRHSPFLVKPEGKTGRVVFSNEKPPPQWQCTLERPYYNTFFKFLNRRCHRIHSTFGFRQKMARLPQTFPTLQCCSYDSDWKAIYYRGLDMYRVIGGDPRQLVMVMDQYVQLQRTHPNHSHEIQSQLWDSVILVKSSHSCGIQS